MVHLLAVEKARLLASGQELTDEAFEQAWAVSWTLMVHERAFPHATVHRRGWRAALIGTKPEMRACFLGQPSGFARYLEQLAEEMSRATAADGVTVGQLVA